jgi:hypothetical protein
MTTSHAPGPKILNLRLALNNYPILAEKIREQMREELFARGIIDPDILGQEAERKAIESQKLEGLTNPYYQESEELWTRRVACIRRLHPRLSHRFLFCL